MVLTIAHNGRRVDVDATERVVIELPENATTGYVWQVTSLAGPARLVTDQPEPGPPTPGAAGLRRLELALNGSGVVTLCAVSRRPWKPDTDALAEYRLEISVRR